MKKKIDIIDSYDRLSVGQYERIAAITADDPVEQSVQMLSVLTGESRDTLMDLPLPEYAELTKKAEFLKELPTGRGRVSSFVGNTMELRVMAEPTKMTAGQYIDYQSIASQEGQHMVELLAVFLIPKGKKYLEDYDVEEVRAVIRDEMPVSVAMGLLNSFLYRLGQSLRASLTFSAWKLKAAARKEKDETKKERMLNSAKELKEAVSSLRAGAGLRALTLLVKASETAGIARVG